MYTNWPFTAKTNTHTIHMSEISLKRFLQRVTSARRALTSYFKVESQGWKHLQLPEKEHRAQTEEEKEKEEE